MSTHATSETPILDLIEPLPKPFDERITGRFAGPFLASVACVAIGQNYPLLRILFGSLAINFLAVLVHEVGHLCGGWLGGFGFEGVTVGPVVLKRLRTGYSFRLRPRLAGGYAYMTPKRVRHIRRGATLTTLGGPISSFFFGLAAIVNTEIARAYYESFWITFFGFFGFYSLFVGAVSFVPYRVGPYANDGMLLRTLIKSKEGARSLLANYGLSALRNQNPEGVHWNSRWANLAAASQSSTPYAAAWYKYWLTQNSQNADSLLETCLANSHLVEREYRAHLMAEAIKICAWDRDDPQKAEQWLKRLDGEERLDLLTRARMKVAVHASLRDFDRALQEWKVGLALIQQSPASIAQRDYETLWQAWWTEIQTRATTRVPLAEPTPVEA